MKIHNTLTKKTENFKPITPGIVKLYTCGPTVYDYAQLGNLRSFVFYDTLRRALSAQGFKVRHVMNITDVGHLSSDMDEGEDKLEKGAEREGKSVWDISKYYTDIFKNDVKELNILEPNAYEGPDGPYAKATDFIEEQIEIIKLLLEKSFAYQTKQAIYFDVTKLDSYGELSGQKLEQKETAVRQEVVSDPAKHHPQDFALWFFLVGRFARHSMKWPSPWGDGFPGWHLECSAIIHATIGDPIDIHTGGVDHIGTHHTNEMAQTEAAFGHKLANYWVHNEFLLVDSQKMSKSLGNFLTLKDVVDKGFEPLSIRLLFLQAHYRSELNFTWESLGAAQAFLKHLQAWADLKFQPAVKSSSDQGKFYEHSINKLNGLVADDLNTAEALSELSQLAATSEEQGVDHTSFESLLQKVDELLGLGLTDRHDIDQTQKDLLTNRQTARESSDWQLSDELRDRLQSAGLGVNDTKFGQVWYRL
ncbi:MAG TPA: cysteine--tRNA ligase [Candidatus Saccharimonadales bacterium]|nr:cysteine--tRNA ligase [Candidatus Saccharimonadales bacterium]